MNLQSERIKKPEGSNVNSSVSPNAVIPPLEDNRPTAAVQRKAFDVANSNPHQNKRLNNGLQPKLAGEQIQLKNKKSQSEPPSQVEDSKPEEGEEKISFNVAGMQIGGIYNPLSDEGKISATGGPLGKYVALNGQVEKSEDDKGYYIEANASIAGIKSPKLEYSIPLARVPLGIPGIFAAVDMDFAAYAAVGGGFGISFETDASFSNPTNIELDAVSINALAQASIAVFGGVSVGVPKLGEIKVGGEGSATAQLNADINLLANTEGLVLYGTMSGIATGKLAAVAEAHLLWLSKKYSIPIVEGVVGSFEKELDGIVLVNPDSLKALISFNAKHFTKGKPKPKKENENHLQEEIKKKKEKKKKSKKDEQNEKESAESSGMSMGGFSTTLGSSSLKR